VKVRDWVARSWWQLALVGLAAIAVFTYWSTERGSQVRAEAKAEQDQRAYVAKRRGDCYEIFTKERSRFSNAQAPEYDPDDDVVGCATGAASPILPAQTWRLCQIRFTSPCWIVAVSIA
jgi:hypothetical protein